MQLDIQLSVVACNHNEPLLLIQLTRIDLLLDLSNQWSRECAIFYFHQELSQLQKKGISYV
jgi:hypothetical protein